MTDITLKRLVDSEGSARRKEGTWPVQHTLSFTGQSYKSHSKAKLPAHTQMRADMVG